MIRGRNQSPQKPFLEKFNPTDLRTASEFLSNWLPFLTQDLCDHCTHRVSHRVRSLNPSGDLNEYNDNEDDHDINDTEDTNSLGSWKDGANGISEPIENNIKTETVQSPSPERAKTTSSSRMSWADMAQEDFDAEEEEEGKGQFDHYTLQTEDTREIKTARKPELSREQRERIRFTNVKRKKDFICLERVNGKFVNILDGLELHCDVFSAVEQKRIVDFVCDLQEKGKNGELKDRTYMAPVKWMRGKGRVTIQFGCCYNYATDKHGNPPGILQNELVDPIPHLFKLIIKRLVKWHVLPPTCVPDSCIVNIYDEGDCIPPHIDNHDFLRPFCTLSFLSECKILFGTNLKIEGPGEFSGAFDISLPVGSVLVLNGNGADVAKHCVPAVPAKRISITFRKMDESKHPVGFVPEPDLQGVKPLVYESDKPKGGSNLYKAGHPSNRQVIRRDDVKDGSQRGYLQPRFYGQTRQQGSGSAYRWKGRSEY
ncbi:RNA demethylase ALKBH9B-like [Bidens hawaiensis]|uniref:RNA demethylase ALKBH9B-like n=1 Tax=Bidens hawaiensis TaxID=980011 RepID=UPI0040491EE4